MIGVLVVTHGSIGEALLTSASQILGSMPPQVATLSVWRQDDPDDLVLRARELLDGLDAGDGVLVLTDIFGATPGNVVSRLLQDGRIEGVSGVSLPMLLRVLTGRNGGKIGAAGNKLRGGVERALSGGAEGLVHMNQDRCCDA
jgi:mannose PTS system EIIA component